MHGITTRLRRRALWIFGALLAGAAGCSEGGCAGSTPDSQPPASPQASAQAPAAELTPDITPALKKKLQAALEAKGPDYEPRTRHENPDGSPKYTNRLILESSPYLLQHAHNPVNWFPWGDEAFAIAEATGRPVFLSVGYATCHWCHVMEEESFEDEAIAQYINEHYIPIKVDREERPDVDSLYMTAVQLLTGRGGWPMSVWLTPDREPFFAGTYFPARDGDRGTRRGFLTILKSQYQRFQQSPETVAERAERVTRRLQKALKPAVPEGVAGPEVLDRAVATAKRRFDPVWGGPRGAPKFPSNFPTRLLFRHAHRTGDDEARNMAHETLTKMAAGGIYDHVGGGFHRYSTDQRWLVPHFEKMLYDQALLVQAYLDGYQATGDGNLARVVRETLDYVLREMTNADGAFYSATDADSLAPSGHREEGYYFTWTPDELEAVLGTAKARVLETYYATSERGNFEGRNILHTPKPRDAVAAELNLPLSDFEALLDESRARLRKARAERPPPLTDDKIQASWNGLMLGALARAGLILNEPKYPRAAERAASFILSEMRREGRLRHTAKDGALSEQAFLEDYAFVTAGLIDLFEATSSPRYLSEAIALMNQLEKLHVDANGGGYYRTPRDGEKLLFREKPDRDKATPSGNSVALMNHLRLYELTTDDRWKERATHTLRAFSPVLEKRPSALEEMLLAVDFFYDTPKEVALVAPEGNEGSGASTALPLLDAFRTTFVPNSVFVMGAPEKLSSPPFSDRVPWASDKPAKREQATAYVCERGRCELPTTQPEVFARQLVSR